MFNLHELNESFRPKFQFRECVSIPWKRIYWTLLSCGVVYNWVFNTKLVITFEPVDENLKFNYSDESFQVAWFVIYYKVVLTCVYGWNPKVRTLKWKLLNSTFLWWWCCLLCCTMCRQIKSLSVTLQSSSSAVLSVFHSKHFLPSETKFVTFLNYSFCCF